MRKPMRKPTTTYGSKGIAAYRYHHNYRELGAEHPATRASLGRLRAHRGDVPQMDAVSVEAIAWRRESGAAKGFMNRRARQQRGAV